MANTAATMDARRSKRTHHPLEIPKDRWSPTPMEVRLRAEAVRRTYGMLKGTLSPSEFIRWQRKMRVVDRTHDARLDALRERLRGGQRRKTAHRGKRSSRRR